MVLIYREIAIRIYNVTAYHVYKQYNIILHEITLRESNFQKFPGETCPHIFLVYMLLFRLFTHQGMAAFFHIVQSNPKQPSCKKRVRP